MKKPLKIVAVVFALAVLAEVGLRATAIADFPLYDADNDIGYIPKASQSGAFLWKNDWQFNAKNMGAAEFKPGAAVDTLLIGDSIVLGGNPYKQADRLGPQLSRVLGQPVWPIAAGSWALRNELKYLKRHPEVVRSVGRIIFVSNSGDFDEASSWACEETHPRSRPLLVSVYLLKKYVYNWAPCGAGPVALHVPAGDWKPELQEFLASEPAKGKVIRFIMYPDKEEATDAKLLQSRLETHIPELLLDGVDASAIYDVGRDPRWNAGYYRDEIHPTVEGMTVLAKIISAPLASATK